MLPRVMVEPVLEPDKVMAFAAAKAELVLKVTDLPASMLSVSTFAKAAVLVTVKLPLVVVPLVEIFREVSLVPKSVRVTELVAACL